MKKSIVLALFLCGGLRYATAASTPAAVVRRVSVLGAGNHVEIEIDTTQPIVPQTLAISNPNRLVVDFPGAVPGKELRNLKVNRREVKDIRVGLFTANPPTTRVVLDLAGPQPYQLFPSGRSVIVKVGNSGVVSSHAVSPLASPPAAKPAALETAVAIPVPAQSGLEVEFRDGELTIRATHATLAQVLREVHRQTGAEIVIPPAAEQEQVIADYGPGPANQVMAALLNGSPFDFVLVGSAHDPSRLASVLLTPRGGGAGSDSQFYPAVTDPPSDANADGVQDPPPDTSVGPDMQQPPQ